MARRDGSVNAAIRRAFEESGLGKRELARRVYGNADRWRDINKYIDDNGPTPGLSLAVRYALALGQPEDAFLTTTPLQMIADELETVATDLARGFENSLAAIDALSSAVERLERRLRDLDGRPLRPSNAPSSKK